MGGKKSAKTHYLTTNNLPISWLQPVTSLSPSWFPGQEIVRHTTPVNLQIVVFTFWFLYRLNRVVLIFPFKSLPVGKIPTMSNTLSPITASKQENCWWSVFLHDIAWLIDNFIRQQKGGPIRLMWKVIMFLHSEKWINGSGSYYWVIESTQRSPSAPQQLKRIITANWTRRYLCSRQQTVLI